MNYAGLDVHKKKINFAVVDGGSVDDDASVRYTAEEEHANSMTGWMKLADSLTRHGVGKVAMECSGIYHVGVSYFLKGRGFDVVTFNPASLKSLWRGKKTDLFDARKIARVLKAGLITPSVSVEPSYFEVRETLRSAARYSGESNRMVNRLKKIVAFVAVRAEDIEKERDVVDFIEKKLDTYVFYKLVKNTPRGTDVGEDDLREAGLRGGVGEDTKTTATVISSFLKALGYLRDEFEGLLDSYWTAIARADRAYLAAARYVEKDPKLSRKLAVMISIPGIGIKTALTILFEVHDFGAFRDVRAFTKWCGMCPTVYQSGDKSRQGGRYMGGNRRIRKALYIAATANYMNKGSSFNGRMREAKTAGKPYKLVIFKNACKLARLIYHLSLKDEYFVKDPSSERVKSKKEMIEVEATAFRRMWPKILKKLGRLESLLDVKAGKLTGSHELEEIEKKIRTMVGEARTDYVGKEKVPATLEED